MQRSAEHRALGKVFAVVALTTTLMIGCSVIVDRWSQVDGRGTVAKAAYMAAFRKIQDRVCTGDSLVVERARHVREAHGVFLRFDCERAAEGGTSD
jgi:hypothetical protein